MKNTNKITKRFPDSPFPDIYNESTSFPKYTKKYISEDTFAFYFERYGWNVYRPYSDTGIDMVITKNDKHGHRLTRFIQLKTRALKHCVTNPKNKPKRIKKNHFYLGYTLSSKDFREDPRHIFILYNDDPSVTGHCDCFILPMYKFLYFLYHNRSIGRAQLSSNSFRQENNKINTLKLYHEPKDSRTSKSGSNNIWTYSSNPNIKNFMNNLDLINDSKIEHNFNKYLIDIDYYKNSLYYSKSAQSKMKKNVLNILKEIKREPAPSRAKKIKAFENRINKYLTKYPDLLNSSEKYYVDKFNDSVGKIHINKETVSNDNTFYKHLDNNGNNKSTKIQLESFKYSLAATKDHYHVYQDVMSPQNILIGRLVCANCHKPWNMEKNECLFCGSSNRHLYRCSNCGRLFKITRNDKTCPYCKAANKQVEKKNAHRNKPLHKINYKLRPLCLNGDCPTNNPRYKSLFTKARKTDGVFKRSSPLSIRQNHCIYCGCRLNYYYFAEIQIILLPQVKSNHKLFKELGKKFNKLDKLNKLDSHINYVGIKRNNNYKATSYYVYHNGKHKIYKSIKELLKGILSNGIDPSISQQPLTTQEKNRLHKFKDSNVQISINS